MTFFRKLSQSIAQLTNFVEHLLGDHRARPTKIRLLRSQYSGNDHTMQLWLYAEPAGFRFEVRQLYGPRGRIFRACTLESGAYEKLESTACLKGNQVFDKLIG
jgi:hypothetical protein